MITAAGNRLCLTISMFSMSKGAEVPFGSPPNRVCCADVCAAPRGQGDIVDTEEEGADAEEWLCAYTRGHKVHGAEEEITLLRAPMSCL